MRNRRIILWIVIVVVVAGGAIAVLGYRLYMAKRKYVSTDGEFSLLLPRNCGEPEISHFEDRNVWIWNCKDSSKVILLKQHLDLEDLRRKAATDAANKSDIPTDELEGAMAGYVIGQFLKSSVPCMLTPAGYTGTAEFIPITREFKVTKVAVDGQHNAYSTIPLEAQCKHDTYWVEVVNSHVMVLFAASNLYQLTLVQIKPSPDRFNEIVRSFHVM